MSILLPMIYIPSGDLTAKAKAVPVRCGKKHLHGVRSAHDGDECSIGWRNQNRAEGFHPLHLVFQSRFLPALSRGYSWFAHPHERLKFDLWPLTAIRLFPSLSGMHSVSGVGRPNKGHPDPTPSRIQRFYNL
jgi:hypothetical protein